MRKHGWQLPYHPLQVVAIAVFLALGFAFYVFFLPFVGNKVFQYVVMALYTPLVACVLFLYIWCTATDPGDPGVFMSKKYVNVEHNARNTNPNKSKQVGSINEEDVVATEGNSLEDCIKSGSIGADSPNRPGKEKSGCCNVPFLANMLGWCLLSFSCRYHSRKQSSEQQKSEDGMFFCTLCEVEVLKYSKHCRVCDKCVDSFDHHCRWLNNCIGKRNYRRFVVLMVSALLMLILQWCIGVLVLILCFLERKRFSVEIGAKLGSSFSLVPFIIVVVSCTVLAMLATLPLAQLFFFHVLLIKKGISTYDYIVALREQEQEQEQQGVGQQSPQMSSVSSFTGLSSASSFSALRRDAWCTPPRLFLEDQFDVVPPEVGVSFRNTGKKTMPEESARKRSAGNVKISPWTLARLSAEEVSKAAAEAKKRSKILQPIARRETLRGHETDGGYDSGRSGVVMGPDNKKKKANKRGRLPKDLPPETLAKVSSGGERPPETSSSSLAPLQLAARSAFQTSRSMSSNLVVAASSPASSLNSPDLHPFRVSSSDSRELMCLPSGAAATGEKGAQLLRSTSSDGYEASGGEDSDQVPSRIVHRSVNWSNLLFHSGRGDLSDGSNASSFAGPQAGSTRRL